jgi:hypothetical protein
MDLKGSEKAKARRTAESEAGRGIPLNDRKPDKTKWPVRLCAKGRNSRECTCDIGIVDELMGDGEKKKGQESRS